MPENNTLKAKEKIKEKPIQSRAFTQIYMFVRTQELKLKTLYYNQL